jgi:hypothetical protein
MTAGVMPDVSRYHLTRRANQRHDAIIRKRRVTGGTLARPVEAGAIQPHAQAQTSGDAEGAVDPLHLRRDRLEGDLAASGFPCALVARPGDNLDVAVERGEKGHQAANPVFAEVTLEQPRYFGLRDAHQRPGLLLRELAFAGEAIKLGDDLGLEEMIVSVG